MSHLQRLRESFWFIPAVLCLLAAVLAEALIALDRTFGDLDLPTWAGAVLYRVGESGSRDVLGAIATSSLAVAGTTFSITIAVLALTSSSYGPRLVRNFMADRGNQTVLGVYVATFLYALLVLRSIRALEEDAEEVFVPHLATNVAVLLAVVNVGVLIWFIHHVSDSIQVSTIARRVRSELAGTVDRLYPEELGRGPGEVPSVADDPSDGRPVDERVLTGLVERVVREGHEVPSTGAGYVRSVREDALLDVAREHGTLVALRIRPGQYVLEGTCLARLAPTSARDVADVVAAVRDCVEIGDTRSPAQDVEFGVQQLTELAVRALSPGTNDPYTAVNALDDLSAGLARLGGRPLPAPVRLDAEGAPRVHAPRPSVLELVVPVLDAMRWYAAASPAVMLATLDLVERVAVRAVAPDVRRGLADQLDRLGDAFRAAGHHADDGRRWDARVAEVARAAADGPGCGTSATG